MGLGADTIEAMAAPYREAETSLRIKTQRTIEFLGKASDSDRERLLLLAETIATSDVFEAARCGIIGPEKGAYIIGLIREADYRALPWFVRAVMWISGRRWS